MQKGVHGRFLDQSTSVREAAVELVGKFILIRPELIPKYYDMLSERILVIYIELNFHYKKNTSCGKVIFFQILNKTDEFPF